MGALLATTLLVTVLIVPATAADAAPVLLSQGRPATASSLENPDYTPAAAAFDGDTGTRWSSQFGDDQWLQVDLGQVASIERIELVWESAHARAYELQVSDDGETGWTTIHATSDGAGGTETVPVDGEGRYVRMQGIARATGYGYSLWELRVFGIAGGTDPSEPPDPGDPVGPGYPDVPGPLTGPSVVEVAGSDGDWRLEVDGRPYTVRGFTWGPPFSAADQHMPDLVAMGANTTRTWGTGADTIQLLDAAAALGVRVIHGFWLLPGGGPGSGGCIDYTSDTAYKTTTRADILSWVERYRSHPATLMWNVGNESLLGLQNCYSGAELEEQRTAYAAFVNEVAVAIHQVDPDHPVTSTDAWTGAWPYYQEHAPDLDLLAVNAYQDVCGIEQTWSDGGYDRPYIVTEGGPAGEWEVPDDANGVPDEPTDLEKAQGYVDAWRCVLGHEGVGLGATLFHYGIEGDFGGVWFNVIPGGNKRLGSYAIAEEGQGDPSANTPPRITAMDIPGSTAVVAGATLDIDLDVSDPDGDALAYFTFFNSRYIDGAGGVAFVEHEQTGPGQLRVTAPQMLGVWKAYVFVEDGNGNVGVETRSFRVVPPAVDGTNVARGRPADASSFQTTIDDFTPGQAFDGDLSTRWASEWSDDQWLQVDLGQPTAFDHVQLVWEAAYGRAYQVQTSNDGSTWTTIHTVSGGDGGVDDLDVAGQGRYVRIRMTERGTAYGYSLHEVGVYRSN